KAESIVRLALEEQGISWSTESGKGALAWSSIRALFYLRQGAHEVLEVAGVSEGGPKRVRLARDAFERAPGEADLATLPRLGAERSGVAIDRRADEISLRPTLIGGIPLPNHFASPPEIRAHMADPFEFACAFICAQRGVLATRPL